MVKIQAAGGVGLVTLGYLWFLLGIAWAPSNKIYQQGLVLLLWLPGLLSVFFFRERLLEVWRNHRVFCSLLLLFLGWAALSVLWTQAQEPVRELKRVLYVGLFLVVLALLASVRPERVWKGLATAFVFLALSCPLSFYFYYIRDMHPLSDRLYGMGQVDHPILGAYVIALAVIWGGQFLPRGRWERMLWVGLMAMALMFIVLGQSRGAMLALIAGVCTMPLWGGGRIAWVGCLSILAAAGVGYLFFEPLILLRGLSYRPEIFLASMDMVMQSPLLGLGIGSDYQVVTANYPKGFDHSHNGFTHVAIELGLLGVALWGVLWLVAFRIAWCSRQSREGRLVLGSLLVSVVALQFDASSLWDTPRAEWFVTWLPLGLVVALVARNRSARLRPADPCSELIDE